MNATLEVVAGVLRNAQGQLLLAQRKPDGDLAGLWEFPGGKREADETAASALARELREELGVSVRECSPLIRVSWHYPHKAVRLDVYTVERWQGTVQAQEGQALHWLPLAELTRARMPAADWPAVRALRLPPRLLITPDSGDLRALADAAQRALSGPRCLLRLRLPQLSQAESRALAAQLLARAQARHGDVLLGGDIDGALRLGCGLQLNARQLATLGARPLPEAQWCGASCHDAQDLARAALLDCDFAVLGPVLPTPSHPGAPALGWPRFAALCATAALPVYALGGLTPADHEHARALGAQGVAGIRGFWPGLAAA
ncbi:Nudix family hydrolase [Metallibacterium scheffleri]